MRPRGAILGALALILAGCGGGAAPPAPGPVAAPPRPAVPAAPKVPEAGPPLPPLSYEARQRRDPFQPQVVTPTGTRGLSVAAVKLVGVVQGRLAPLALVEAPDGIGYILKSGDVLGDGRVTEIGSDSVSFAVAARPGAAPTVVTLRLRTD